MSGNASVQVVPVTKTDHSGLKVAAIQGISVLRQGGKFLLTTIDTSGTALTAHLSEEALNRFAHQLADAIGDHNSAKIKGESLLIPADEPLVQSIILAVAQRCGIGVRDVTGGGREKHIVRARFAAIWAARTATRCTFPMLARIFNYSDEGSVQDAFRKAGEWRGDDFYFRRLTDDLIAKIADSAPTAIVTPDGDSAA